MPVQSSSENHSWWTELNHGGILISPALLTEQFPETASLFPWKYNRLPGRYNSFETWWSSQGASGQRDGAPLHRWLDAVLDDFLGHESRLWQKGPDVPLELSVNAASGERLRPNRVLFADAERKRPSLLVMVDRVPRIGYGRGRTGYSRLLELLRLTGQKLGLITNGMQFRLCYSGLDYDAWTEWDASAWFDEGELRRQLEGFLTLLGPDALKENENRVIPLLRAVEESRFRQGELSTVMGEQVRESVELLLGELDDALRKHPDLLDVIRRVPDNAEELPGKQVTGALYQAVCRIVMRIVVVLFAEARGLLPRNLVNYNESYGVEGLYEQLRLAVAHEGIGSLEERWSAWQRLLALFRLVQEGSVDPAIPVPAYGGLLFRPGSAGNPDPILRALAVMEDPRLEVSDATIYRLMDRLKVGAIKIKRGNSMTMVRGPVDFRDLRTEFIGIMYEGLLDYELKAADRLMVFLNIGQEPVLPLDILENMPDRNLKDLLEKLSKESGSAPAAGGEESGQDTGDEQSSQEEAEPAEAGEELDPSAEETSDETVDAEEEDREDTGLLTEEDVRKDRAFQWALRAVEVAGLVRKPRGKKGSDDYYYQQDRQKAARKLIKRVLDQGELYLARWGGTRKGSGTFYTKPGLAVPTVHRTLEPLCYVAKEELGTRNEELGAGNQEPGEERDSGASQELQRPDSLAEGYGPGSTMLPDDAGVSRQPEVQPDESASEGGNFGSGQHSGGTREAGDRGLHSSSFNSARITDGVGDSHSDSEAAELSGGKHSSAFPEADRRDRTDAEQSGCLFEDSTQFSALTPRSYILIPQTPEHILSLKVCDPACGSASFLVAATHYLTDALYRSLIFHRHIDDPEAEVPKTLPFGTASAPGLREELLPCKPSEAEFEKRVKVRLRRHVVERCIYGVDINPMAIELARLSLWIETMDPELPFEFLDHKIKVGNSLVGCWFDRFRHYPLAAWLRDGGDKSHSNGVNFGKGQWTKDIKNFLNSRVKPELARKIQQDAGQPELSFEESGLPDPVAVHDEASAFLEKLHSMPLSFERTEEMESLYAQFIKSEHYQALKDAFDTWCAVWFWPGDKLECAPTPENFLQPPEETLEEVRGLAQNLRFFHWELEFPDVFRGAGDSSPDSTIIKLNSYSGFDAVLGNPPWDVSKPNSKEFFSNVDPIYRTYGKQEALAEQERLFRDRNIEREWLLYSAGFKAMSNWCGSVALPFGDPADGATAISLSKAKGENLRLHNWWREQRNLTSGSGYADPEHPFSLQGSADINTYKLFLEECHALLRSGSRLGMIVPSGLYTDKGTTDLRECFLDHCSWEWLFGFENRKGIFDIHRSFKFCPIIISKGAVTEEVRAAFMRHDLSDWEGAEKFVIEYPRERARQFSPNSRAILEVRTRRDLELLEKIYANSVLLGDQGPDGWGIKYACEFHMTNDSHLFPPRPKWEEKGYRPDIYGRWLLGGARNEDLGARASSPPNSHIPNPSSLSPGVIPMRDGSFVREEDIEDVALPLYVGKMIEQFDISYTGWISGAGRGAVWRRVPDVSKEFLPGHLLGEDDFRARKRDPLTMRVALMDITTAVHHRTGLFACIPDFPCSHLVPVLHTKNAQALPTAALSALLNAFPFDLCAKLKVAYLHLGLFVLEELPVPARTKLINTTATTVVALAAARLTWIHKVLAASWLLIAGAKPAVRSEPFGRDWAVTQHERLRLRCILDAIVAELYGLDEDDFAWILREDRSDPKGFWRVDQDKPKELRHTTLAQVAFHDLKEMGLDAFCALNDGDGWQIPEGIRIESAGTGGEIRAYSVPPGSSILNPRASLGPRFLPWQLEQSVEDSWAECEIHARNILGEEGFEKLQEEIAGGNEGSGDERESTSRFQKKDLFGPAQGRLL